jgi:hypothetical protein
MNGRQAGAHNPAPGNGNLALVTVADTAVETPRRTAARSGAQLADAVGEESGSQVLTGAGRNPPPVEREGDGRAPRPWPENGMVVDTGRRQAFRAREIWPVHVTTSASLAV